MLSTLSAEELACRAQAGSSAAFDVLAERFGPRLLRYLSQRTRRPHDAEDLRQETLLRAYENLHRYDPGRPFSAWLFTIAARLAVSHLRRRPPGMPLEPAAVPAIAAGPAEVSARRDLSENLWRAAAAALPERQYRALWLRYAEDLPIRGVARALGLTRTHAKVLLHRARKRLMATRAFEALGGVRAEEPARPAANRKV